MPLYAKTHSYGEYVFDWAWADAYRRYGHRYYPKLVAAIPFTPAPGPRLFAVDAAARTALLQAALEALRARPRGGEPSFSSLHVLFPTEAEARACEAAGMIVRNGVQFRWENPGFRDFADFLATFNHDKRKKVKQERRRVAESGIVFTRKVGCEITSADWSFFHRCYERTYRDHHSTPYLTLEFFERIGAELPDNVMLALGHRDGRGRSARRSTSSTPTRCGAAIGGRPSTCRDCTSRPATTRPSTSASSGRSPGSKAARRASTSLPGASCR